MTNPWDESLPLGMLEPQGLNESSGKRKRDSAWNILSQFGNLSASVDSICSEDADEDTSSKKIRLNSSLPDDDEFCSDPESELEEEAFVTSPLNPTSFLEHLPSTLRSSTPSIVDSSSPSFAGDDPSSSSMASKNPLLHVCDEIMNNVRAASENETLNTLLRQSGLYEDLTGLLNRVKAVCEFKSFTQHHAVAPFSLALGNFYALPPELLFHLFSFLDPREICVMRSVCREFCSIGRRETLWKTLFERRGYTIHNTLMEKYGKGWEFMYRAKTVQLKLPMPADSIMVGYMRRADRQVQYEGEWKDGRLHGYGIEISLANGSTREGEWKNGSMNGFGVWTRKDKTGKDVYEGMWVDDKREGRGLMVYNHGRRYDGDWLRGKRHGKGETHNNGRKYRGELQDGKIHGFGAMKYTDGRRYVGSWVRASRQGNGVMTYADGRVYSGDWWKGKRHGKGRLNYTDGSYYNGDWQKNHRQGRGSMVYATGQAVYEGEWFKSTMHGQGTLVFPDGGIYEGSWVQGQMEGHGIMFYVNGAVYEGQWKANQRHGKGTMMYANGGIFEGTFKKGLEMREKSIWT